MKHHQLSKNKNTRPHTRKLNGWQAERCWWISTLAQNSSSVGSHMCWQWGLNERHVWRWWLRNHKPEGDFLKSVQSQQNVFVNIQEELFLNEYGTCRKEGYWSNRQEGRERARRRDAMGKYCLRGLCLDEKRTARVSVHSVTFLLASGHIQSPHKEDSFPQALACSGL